MKATIATIGRLFGLLQEQTTMINLIGPMRVWRGDSATYVLTVTDDEDEPIDLTGMSIALQVRSAPGASGDPVIDKSVGDGITLLAQSGDTLGQATVELLSADTDKEPGLYYLDAKVADGADVQHVIEPREFTIGAVVTP